MPLLAVTGQVDVDRQVLFRSLAVLDPRVGYTMDVLLHFPCFLSF